MTLVMERPGAAKSGMIRKTKVQEMLGTLEVEGYTFRKDANGKWNGYMLAEAILSYPVDNKEEAVDRVYDYYLKVLSGEVRQPDHRYGD
jgi:hypothetical protein